MVPEFTADENGRDAALRASGLLDASYDQEIADLVGLAAQVCQTSHAAISLLDSTWEWEPSAGRMARSRPRDHALGAWITTRPSPLVVADTQADPVLYANILLGEHPPWHFYAGVPLIQGDGVALGTLYVADVEPRVISDQQVAALVTLSRQIMVQFAWRQQERARAAAPATNDSRRSSPTNDSGQHVLARMQALHELGRQVLRAPSLEALAQRTLEHITETLPCSYASISLYDMAATTRRTLASTRPNQSDPPADPATRIGALDLPISGADQSIGVLTLETNRIDGLSATDVAIAQISATMVAVAIEHLRLIERVRAGRDRLTMMSRRLIAVQEDERRHLARELHDEIGQALTAIRINLQHVYGALPTAEDKAYVQDSIAIVHQLVQQVRTLSLDLRPSMLDDLGLMSAVRWYLNRQAHRSGLTIHFIEGDDPVDLDPTIATACFRIVQESLTNILRHAQATSVTVALYVTADEVTLSVEDDGHGFDPALLQRGAAGESLGLLGIQERAALVGGICTIHTAAGAGTQVRARFPLGADHLDRRQVARFDDDQGD